MMKKLLCAALAALMTLSLAACSKQEGGSVAYGGDGTPPSSAAAPPSSTPSAAPSSEAPSSAASIPEKGTTSDFSYGTEKDFYKADEAKSKNPTAVAVVKNNLSAVAKNDYKAWLKTLTASRQKGLASKKTMDFGVLTMEVSSTEYENDNRYKHQALESEKGKKEKWTADNMAVVSATYGASYDPEVVNTPNGITTVKYLLIRASATAPWAVQDWNLPLPE